MLLSDGGGCVDSKGTWAISSTLFSTGGLGCDDADDLAGSMCNILPQGSSQPFSFMVSHVVRQTKPTGNHVVVVWGWDGITHVGSLPPTHI